MTHDPMTQINDLVKW